MAATAVKHKFGTHALVNRVLHSPFEGDISTGASTRLDEAEGASIDLDIRGECELQFGCRRRSGGRILSGIDHGCKRGSIKIMSSDETPLETTRLKIGGF